MSEEETDKSDTAAVPPSRTSSRRRIILLLAGTALAGAVAAALVALLLVNIMERKQEARNPFYRVVELTDDTVDPAVWGKNFPLQYDGYRRTVDQVRTRYGGSEAVPRTPSQADPRSVVAQSRLEEDPRLRRCGPATRSRSTSARSAATPTCWRIRPSPSARRPPSSPAPVCTVMPRSTPPTRRRAAATSSPGSRS